MGHSLAARGGAVVGGAAIVATMIAGCTAPPGPTPSPTAADIADAPQSALVEEVVDTFMAEHHLAAVIVEVQVGDDLISSQAFGESLPGMPATTDMNFRNGAIAFAYLGTLLMLFVDDGKVTLDDPIDEWMPDLPLADQVTLRMLVQQTSGYPDFETDPVWQAAYIGDPFRDFSYEERIQYAFERPQVFEPGTGWSYAHTNFAILGEALAKIGGKPLEVLLQERVLDPMGLTHTVNHFDGFVPNPVLHSLEAERRTFFNIDPSQPFAEEATFWSTTWGTPVGANQTSTIADVTKTAIAVGSGSLLSPESYQAMTESTLIGVGERKDSCSPSCFPQTDFYNYGLGVVLSGDWIVQTPNLSGQSAAFAYLPSEKVAISVVSTFTGESFDEFGGVPNISDQIWRAIAAELVPDHTPPTRD